MIGGIPPKLRGLIVAHVADGWSLVLIEAREAYQKRPVEIPFPTEFLPLECRELGSCMLVTWDPYSAVRWRENLN